MTSTTGERRARWRKRARTGSKSRSRPSAGSLGSTGGASAAMLGMRRASSWRKAPSSPRAGSGTARWLPIASTKGRKLAASSPSAQAPLSTRAPPAAALPTSSATSRLLPMPASPVTTAARPLPSAAWRSRSSSSASSFARPIRTGQRTLSLTHLSPAAPRRGHHKPVQLAAEGADDPARVGNQPGVGGDADHHVAGVAQDADPQAEMPRQRDPEHAVGDPPAGEVEGLAGTRQVGHHDARLAAEELDRRRGGLAGPEPERGYHAQGGDRLPPPPLP